MPNPAWDDFVRYLMAKRTVDDRALNRTVWDHFAFILVEAQKSGREPTNVLEIGAGIGTMIERCGERGLFKNCSYRAIDADEENVDTARVQLQKSLQDQGFVTSVKSIDDPLAHQRLRSFAIQCRCTYEDGTADVLEVSYEQADLFDFASRRDVHQQFDFLIAHAFLDLVDAPRALARLKHLLRPKAYLYLTINFDGGTILQPTIDRELDGKIERLYHMTMDSRIVNGKRSGDSMSGRHMFGHLHGAHMDIVAAGSSDWVVFAGREGYPADEAYFLHFIIDTIHGALAGHPQLDRNRFEEWIGLRHRQIESGELVYIAHQLDFLARRQHGS